MTDDRLRQINALWHRNHERRLGDLSDRLWKEPRFKAAFGTRARVAGGRGETDWVWYDHTPGAVMLCPRGHRIIGVEMFPDHNWELSVAPVEDEATSDTPVASSARWSVRSGPKAARVCSVHGCPTIDTAGPYCAQHAVGRANGENETMNLRTRITCPEPRCGYSGVHQQESLVLLLADAIIKGRKRFRLPS